MSSPVAGFRLKQSNLYKEFGLGQISAEEERWVGESTAPHSFDPEAQKAYPFTTENIKSYIGSLSLSNSRVAAICGSGDFGFSAIMAGARSVDHVDALKTACLYAELKAVGLKHLDFRGFKQFFGSSHEDSGVTSAGRMAYANYLDLREDLTPQASHYFDQLITPSGPSPYLQYGFLINKIADVPANMDMVPYLHSKRTYEAARLSREKSQFYPISMQEFSQAAEEMSYDTVYVSNIGAYMQATEYTDLLIDCLRIVPPGGKIIETGFIYPGDSIKNIAEQKHYLAELIGSATLPQIIEGVYIPMPWYRTHATIYTKNS